MSSRTSAGAGRTMPWAVPEIVVALFAFLLNLAWEFLQVPFFAGMASMPHWEGIRLCIQAAGGDTLIVLAAFWITSGLGGTRRWIVRPSYRSGALFVGTAWLTAMLVELVCVHVLNRWAYAPGMPVVPWLGLGVLPAAQWVVLPPVVMGLASKQLR